MSSTNLYGSLCPINQVCSCGFLEESVVDWKNIGYSKYPRNTVVKYKGRLYTNRHFTIEPYLTGVIILLVKIRQNIGWKFKNNE